MAVVAAVVTDDIQTRRSLDTTTGQLSAVQGQLTQRTSERDTARNQLAAAQSAGVGLQRDLDAATQRVAALTQQEQADRQQADSLTTCADNQAVAFQDIASHASLATFETDYRAAYASCVNVPVNLPVP